jgi:hypothetical protein
MPDVAALETPERLRLLNDVFAQISKAPVETIEAVIATRLKFDLVLGSVTSHPDMQYLRGVTPKGWPKEKTWDQVPGAGGRSTVIAADQIHKFRGPANLVLHEHAHTYEYALKKLNGTLISSDDKEFLDILGKTRWIKNDAITLGPYPEEAFAEGFARYFHSPKTRERLRSDYPELADWFARKFPDR